MTTRTAANSCTTLRSLLNAEADLNQQAEKLRKEKSPGTVIFFDLVGSTDYRRRHGPEKGIRKAFLHNIHVSRAIKECDGAVVKWMGDGVMGSFTYDKCGDKHALRALNAALSGLKRLADLNGKDQSVDDELHTKVSISSGDFHYLNVSELVTDGASRQDIDIEGHPGTALDPIGTEVDLAARLNAMCSMDVILIDADTFWGSSNGNTPKSPGNRPICKADRDSLTWRELILPHVRETVYLPTTAGLFVDDDGLSPCRVGKGSTEPVKADEFREWVKQDAGGNGHTRSYVFCSKPIPCNVRGISTAVDVVAISTIPHPAPVKEQVYDWHPDEIKQIEARAEQAFRQGDVTHALQQYREILEKDSRQFYANTRVAMILRSQKNSDGAMKHLMAAKQSNPTCPIVWGVAGITHLDDFIRDNGDKTECLTRAVIGLSRARFLAEQQFHGLMEQYCTAMLAIVLMLRGKPEDKTQAKSLIDKLELWPAKNSTVAIIKRISASYLAMLEEKGRGTTTIPVVDGLFKDHEEGKLVATEESARVPYDHLISNGDINNLIAKARYLMTLA